MKMGKRSHVGENEKHKSKKQKLDKNPKSLNDKEPKKKGKWTNRTRVLMFSSRGISYRSRHLMDDLRRLMPHTKKESKMNRKDSLSVINEIAEMKNCSKCVFFQMKKKEDLYLWLSSIPKGPCVKFLVENIHTMLELKMTGNCLTTSRPILSFDKAFDNTPYYKLMKELFIQIFSTPNHHPKSQPFIDRILTFCIDSNRIFVRHYQIVEEDGSLNEIGPRFVLNPISVFEGSFGGLTLYQNPHYVAPNLYRRQIRLANSVKYLNRVEAKKGKVHPEVTYRLDPLDEVFHIVRPEDVE